MTPPAVVTAATAPTVQARVEIVRLQANGYNPSDIARSLNARRVPTPTGRGQWWPSTVRRHVDPGSWAVYHRQVPRAPSMSAAVVPLVCQR